jgi:hypothetical protein
LDEGVRVWLRYCCAVVFNKIMQGGRQEIEQ